MWSVLVAWLLAGAPDAGVPVRSPRELAFLAWADCERSEDAGVWLKQFGNCVVTCSPAGAMAKLLDGGMCFVPVRVKPVPVGDFWMPGQWPYSETTPRWPLD